MTSYGTLVTIMSVMLLHKDQRKNTYPFMNEKLLQNLQHLLNLFKLLESWKPHFWYTKRNHKTMTNERRKNNQLDEQILGAKAMDNCISGQQNLEMCPSKSHSVTVHVLLEEKCSYQQSYQWLVGKRFSLRFTSSYR